MSPPGRKGGAILSGLAVTLSMEWHREQLFTAKVLPRCSDGELAKPGVISRSAMTMFVGRDNSFNFDSCFMFDGEIRFVARNFRSRIVALGTHEDEV